MTRMFHSQLRLFSQNSGVVSFYIAIQLLVQSFSPELHAQASPVYSFNNYWGVSGWVSGPYLPDAQLQMSKTGKVVRVWWPDSVTNVVLQTTTNLASLGQWTTATTETNIWSPTLPGMQTLALFTTNSQQFFRLARIETNRIPVFEFAIFYDSQLEFTHCATLNVRGRTHANGPICPGPQSAGTTTLTFEDMVTTASSIYRSNLAGYLAVNMDNAKYKGNPAYRTKTPLLTLQDLSTNAHAIVDFPPEGESPTSSIGQQRFFNKAAIALLVSNSTVTLTIKDLGASTGISSNWDYTIPAQLTNMTKYLSFLSITNTFKDYREGVKQVLATQLDMGRLKIWIYTNSLLTNIFPAGSAPYPNIMYVGDFRTGGNLLYAVRVFNGQVIPTNGPSHALATGFTLATPNPLYIWGHYNCPDPAALGNTNTSKTFPASLICDALTILSPNWNDSTYGNTTTLSSRIAANTTVNAAIIAGTVYSTGTSSSTYSGGLQNLPRLLENWSGGTLTLNTSLVNLYPSIRATNQFQFPGIYYNGPTRNYNFNTNYLSPSRLPPGTPVVVSVAPAN